MQPIQPTGIATAQFIQLVRWGGGQSAVYICVIHISDKCDGGRLRLDTTLFYKCDGGRLRLDTTFFYMSSLWPNERLYDLSST